MESIKNSSKTESESESGDEDSFGQMNINNCICVFKKMLLLLQIQFNNNKFCKPCDGALHKSGNQKHIKAEKIFLLQEKKIVRYVRVIQNH